MKYSVFFFLIFFPLTVLAGDVQQIKNPETGLLTWKIDDRGFSLELIQLLPDFVRAVYGSHDFPPEAIEEIADYCVFGTIVINTSGKRLSYRVSDWHAMTADGKRQPLKNKTQWVDEWRKMGIRYSWTILPAEQTFEVGDWSQGFTTVKLPRENPFDLIYSWSVDGKEYVGKIKNMRCAPERLPEK